MARRALPWCVMPDVQFPLPCPACGAKAGDPRSVSTIPRAGFVKLSLVCAACEHRWELEMKANTDRG